MGGVSAPVPTINYSSCSIKRKVGCTIAPLQILYDFQEDVHYTSKGHIRHIEAGGRGSCSKNRNLSILLFTMGQDRVVSAVPSVSTVNTFYVRSTITCCVRLCFCI